MYETKSRGQNWQTVDLGLLFDNSVEFLTDTHPPDNSGLSWKWTQ